ncbi:hypothetical protein KKA15_01730 [Patescibacteria group bacterium]|nr:hypothetical protein [Patescibacteria group bacterium]
MIKKLAKKEIKFAHGMSIIIVFCIAVSITLSVSAYGIKGTYSGSTPQNKLNFGGIVSSYTQSCTMATPSPPACTGIPCPCPICGCVAAPCVPPPPKWSEITLKKFGGNTDFICPQIGFPYLGATQPTPGKFILGWALNLKGQIGLQRN